MTNFVECYSHLSLEGTQRIALYMNTHCVDLIAWNISIEFGVPVALAVYYHLYICTFVIWRNRAC